MKEWFISFFYFSKKERLGAIIMMVVISCIWVFPILFGSNRPDKKIISLAENNEENDFSNGHKFSQASVKSHEFYFDPNRLADSGWKKLGISDKVVKTINNYLSKGGKFRSAEDIRHIYGMKVEDAERLIPYIRIGKNKKTISSHIQDERLQSYYIPNDKKINFKQAENENYIKRKLSKQHFRPVDLNVADTNALIELPGIGSKLAKRIIDFRNHAGGFHSLSQLSDIYGLRDSVYGKLQKYLIVRGSVRKIMINQISADSLALHPYINKYQAKTIIRFRQMHGPFENMGSMKLIHNIDSSTLIKLQPYLSFESNWKK